MVAIFLFVLVIVALIILAVTLVLNSSASKKAGAENQRTYSMEELYTNIVKAVAVENYEEAYDLWHQYESDNRYSLTYKDLSDYYHYAAGLKGYVGAQEVCLNEVKTALEQVSKGFKRASFYLDEVNLLCESVHGAFVKPAPASSVYRMDIKRDGTADLQFDQPKSYTNVSYIKGEKVIWTLEDGKIVSGKVSGGPYFCLLPLRRRAWMCRIAGSSATIWSCAVLIIHMMNQRRRCWRKSRTSSFGLWKRGL